MAASLTIQMEPLFTGEHSFTFGAGAKRKAERKRSQQDCGNSVGHSGTHGPEYATERL